ncbi:MAG: hypothetical protein EOO88_42075 [Pedobacter sp.]|nr:MAG: hypothetical protein EOO88_42075 [Pedobacter sp.]
MKTNFLTKVVLGGAIAISTLSACKKDNNTDGPQVSGPDNSDRKYVTLTAAFPDAEGTAGNGGTLAYALTLAQAADPNFEVNAFTSGYGLRSQRTARVQGSKNGNFLYNIQYTGTDGGIFNKYLVEGGKTFTDTREEVNTEPILGTSPRWVIAGEGVGIGVFASSLIEATGAGVGATFINVKSTAKIAVINLDDPQITRQTEFIIPFTEAQTKDGYQIGRIDMPILNKAKTKVFIGCNLTRTDVTKLSGVNATSGAQTWSSATSQLGTATLVVDYPSLANPKLIYSTQSNFGNNGYRTMIQHLGDDGNIYQATGVNTTGQPHILRLSGTSNEYDNTYLFDLKTALNSTNNVAIRAWRYIKDGVGLVLYTETGVNGGYLALVDLNAKTATKLATDNQTDIGFSGRSANTTTGVTAITGTFSQFQNIGVAGDNFYVPMSPNGIDGNLYIINYKTKTVTKGAKLKNQSGSFYLGAY